jgi:hypothetical protein
MNFRCCFGSMSMLTCAAPPTRDAPYLCHLNTPQGVFLNAKSTRKLLGMGRRARQDVCRMKYFTAKEPDGMEIGADSAAMNNA